MCKDCIRHRKFLEKVFDTANTAADLNAINADDMFALMENISGSPRGAIVISFDENGKIADVDKALEVKKDKKT